MKPVVFVLAFDRAGSLQRLLDSLERAHCPEDTTLVIGLDGGASPDVVSVAEAFAWQRGRKLLRRQDKHLGFRLHMLESGSLFEEYGSVVFLEDDLFVAPHFYSFASAALDYYADDPRIAAVSLYSHSFNETARLPFTPISDRLDVYFMQLPCTWGHAWTGDQWQRFVDWLARENDEVFEHAAIPTNIREWPRTSLKKYIAKYMTEKGLYFVYPQVSRTSNFADAGTNISWNTNIYQTPLAMSEAPVRFGPLSEATGVYDAWSEISPQVLAAASRDLQGRSFCVDLYGTKPPAEVVEPFMLTTRAARNPLAGFDLRLRPREINVLCQVPGGEIRLARTADVEPGRSFARQWWREFVYAFGHLTANQLLIALLGKFGRRLRRILTRARGD